MPRTALPIDSVLEEITLRLDEHSGLVLQAPPGAGKTTRVPPALLKAGLAGPLGLVMLEPRRIAARTATRRIAAEQGWTLGQEVGYQIRFERRASASTRLLVVTEGILVQMLQSDPFLERFGVVVFDEFHERNLASDLSLAMVRRLQEARSDLRVVVMSATLDPEPIASFLGQAPIVRTRGRTYPVDIHYLERPDPRSLPARAASGIERALEASHGDILAFLPGVGEIRRTGEILGPHCRSAGVAIQELFGDLPVDKQDDTLKRGPGRRVVLATNVAESSLTVDGITAVVDSGQARAMRFDPATALDRLELTRISRASADQRAGRAGRQQAGACWRLWTEHDHRSLPEQDTPEILRVDLAGPCLQLLSWGESDLERFGWFEPPHPETLNRAHSLLRDLGAIDGTGVTKLGTQLARLPLHPRLARLLVAGHSRGLPRHAAQMAALLSERDIVHQPRGQRPVVASTVTLSDVLDLRDALEAFERGGYGETALGPVRADRGRQVLRVARELESVARKVLGKPGRADGEIDTALREILLTAFPDRVARRRAPDSQRAVMTGGRGVRLASMSTVKTAQLFLCLDLDDRASEALVRKASAVDRAFLEAQIQAEEVTAFDSERLRVVGWRVTSYRDLELDRVEWDPGADACAETLAKAAAEDLASALPLDDPAVASLRTRLQCLHDWRPELGLPVLDDDVLREVLPWLCAGKRSFADLRRAHLYDILWSRLSYEEQKTFEREAPERLPVPSGSKIRLRYEAGKPPVLAVRIQELFGLLDTPVVAGGKIPVLLHLLAPNQRPQQVTQDLRSFWTTTYPQVRKELQGRYPRHAWPEDPLTARPERRPQRRRQG